MKIRPVGAEMFHADGRTDTGRHDMTKLIVDFRNLAKAPKKKLSRGQVIHREFQVTPHSKPEVTSSSLVDYWSSSSRTVVPQSDV